MREQAALWLARLDKGLGSEERAELRAWLAEDPSHRNAFLELASLWDELDVLAELSELFPLEQPVRAVPHRGRWLLAGSAAVLVVAAFVGYELRFTVEEQVADQRNRVETFETTVPNLFLAGAVIAGRQSGRIFIENGRFHGRVVIEEIAKRLQMVSR